MTKKLLIYGSEVRDGYIICDSKVNRTSLNTKVQNHCFLPLISETAMKQGHADA
ncbi:MAG: hypothetical protein ACLRS3_02850 [Veillonella parvula]